MSEEIATFEEWINQQIAEQEKTKDICEYIDNLSNEECNAIIEKAEALTSVRIIDPATDRPFGEQADDK